MPQKKSEVSAESSLEEEFKKFAVKMESSFKGLDEKISSVDQKISSKLKKMDDKFSEFYKGLQEDINTIKNDVSDINTDIDNLKSQVEGVEKSIEFHSDRVDTLEKAQEERRESLKEELEEKIEQLNKQLMMLEKHDRKYNLIFYGVPEETKERLYQKMRAFFIDYLQIKQERAESIHFANGHRLPTDAKFVGPKPVIIRFTSFEDRELVLSQAYNLAETDKKIRTDLPVPMKKEIAKLAKRLMRLGKVKNYRLESEKRDCHCL